MQDEENVKRRWVVSISEKEMKENEVPLLM